MVLKGWINIKECAYCGEPIKTGEKWTQVDGKYYHWVCWVKQREPLKYWKEIYESGKVKTRDEASRILVGLAKEKGWEEFDWWTPSTKHIIYGKFRMPHGVVKVIIDPIRLKQIRLERELKNISQEKLNKLKEIAEVYGFKAVIEPKGQYIIVENVTSWLDVIDKMEDVINFLREVKYIWIPEEYKGA